MNKSPIKWVGGKSFLLPKILDDIRSTQAKFFIEPFCGSAVLSLNTPSDFTPIANDINYSLINFYRQLQIYQDNLIDCKSFELTESEYYSIRDDFNSLKYSKSADLAKLATSFYYLNKAGFNGLYRENNLGRFNVPWGKRKKIPELPTYSDFYKALDRIIFTNKSYKDLEIPPQSIIYIDPPYDTTFTKYHKTDFTWDNQIELIEWAVNLSVPFIISNQATDRIIDLYTKFGLYIELIEAPRRIAANGNRNNAIEVYSKNF